MNKRFKFVPCHCRPAQRRVVVGMQTSKRRKASNNMTSSCVEDGKMAPQTVEVTTSYPAARLPTVSLRCARK